jgi:hypothetical protein
MNQASEAVRASMHLQPNKFYRSPLQYDLHGQQPFRHFSVLTGKAR